MSANAVAEIGRELGYAGLTGATVLTTLTTAQINSLIAAYDNGTPADKDDGNLNVQPFDKVRLGGGSLTADFDLGTASLRSITGYRYYHRKGAIDIDGTAFSLIAFTDLETTDKQVSQEFTLTGKAFSDRLNYVLGAFYSRETGTDIYESRSFSQLFPGTFNLQDGDVVNRSIGLYGQGNFAITDQLTLNAGIRWSNDRRELTSRNRTQSACNALGVTLASLGTNPCSANYGATFKEISYLIGLDYKITPDIMVFVKHDRGYRSGGVPYDGGNGTSPSSAAASYVPFKPEIVMNYEAGIKADLLDRHLRLNLTYFHNDFSDIQATISIPRPDGGPGTVAKISNDATAKIDGVEGEARVIPTSGLELAGHFSYVKSRFTRFLTGVAGAAGTQNFKGFPLPLAAKWSYGLAGTYTTQIGEAEMRFNADYSYEGPSVANLGFVKRAKHYNLNARVTFGFPKEGFEFSLYGRNLTNYRYLEAPFGGYTSLGFMYGGSYNNPREMGMEASIKF